MSTGLLAFAIVGGFMLAVALSAAIGHILACLIERHETTRRAIEHDAKQEARATIRRSREP